MKKLSDITIDHTLQHDSDLNQLQIFNLAPLYKMGDKLVMGIQNPFISLRDCLTTDSIEKLNMVLLSSQDINRYYDDLNKTDRKITYESIIQTALDQHASDIHFFRKKNLYEFLARPIDRV